jgi:hypothetical protein
MTAREVRMKRIIRLTGFVLALAAPLALWACSNANVYVGVGVAGPWMGPYGAPYPYPVGGVGWGRPF